MIWDVSPSASQRERERERHTEKEQSHAQRSRDERQNRRELSSYEEAAERGLSFSWKTFSPPSLNIPSHTHRHTDAQNTHTVTRRW